MTFYAINNQDSQLNKNMIPIIEPDNQGPWAVRYVFMNHQNNQEFVDNYFLGSKPNFNVRKITKEFSKLWELHNELFDISGQNGNLIWRVKVYNQNENSVDYVEVWKNIDLIDDYFSNEKDSILPNLKIWSSKQKINLSSLIYEKGFIARCIKPYPLISKNLAIKLYNNFIEKSKNKERCIINTKYNSNLNPIT